jgi:hypothetical protein
MLVIGQSLLEQPAPYSDKTPPTVTLLPMPYRTWLICYGIGDDARIWRSNHSAVLDVEHLPDETTFNELMPRMLCTVCNHRGADVTTAWHVPG